MSMPSPHDLKAFEGNSPSLREALHRRFNDDAKYLVSKFDLIARSPSNEGGVSLAEMSDEVVDQRRYHGAARDGSPIAHDRLAEHWVALNLT